MGVIAFNPNYVSHALLYTMNTDDEFPDFIHGSVQRRTHGLK